MLEEEHNGIGPVPVAQGLSLLRRVWPRCAGSVPVVYPVRKGLRYEMMPNNSGGIEVLSEHVSIFRQMIEQGHDRIYINPNMVVYYQRISWQLICKVLKRWRRNC